MKIKKIFIIHILFLFVAIPHFAFPQWEESQLSVHFSVPEIALVDIEPGTNNSINFSILPAVESGNSSKAQESTNTSLWINYSSALSNPKNTRKIVAEISQGELPNGLLLFLQASSYGGIGEGKHGKSAGKIRLSTRPKSIINNIGSCYTGDGINNGHLLTFSLEINNYSRVYASEDTDFNILYTITDN